MEEGEGRRGKRKEESFEGRDHNGGKLWKKGGGVLLACPHQAVSAVGGRTSMRSSPSASPPTRSCSVIADVVSGVMSSSTISSRISIASCAHGPTGVHSSTSHLNLSRFCH